MKAAPPVMSKSAFPELAPSALAGRVPKAAVSGNQSLRNILGTTSPPTPVWESGKGSPGGSGPSTPAWEASLNELTVETNGGAKSKKGKGKQKQTLFTLGSFPA